MPQRSSAHSSPNEALMHVAPRERRAGTALRPARCPAGNGALQRPLTRQCDRSGRAVAKMRTPASKRQPAEAPPDPGRFSWHGRWAGAQHPPRRAVRSPAFRGSPSGRSSLRPWSSRVRPDRALGAARRGRRCGECRTWIGDLRSSGSRCRRRFNFRRAGGGSATTAAVVRTSHDPAAEHRGRIARAPAHRLDDPNHPLEGRPSCAPRPRTTNLRKAQ